MNFWEIFNMMIDFGRTPKIITVSNFPSLPLLPKFHIIKILSFLLVKINLEWKRKEYRVHNTFFGKIIQIVGYRGWNLRVLVSVLWNISHEWTMHFRHLPWLLVWLPYRQRRPSFKIHLHFNYGPSWSVEIRYFMEMKKHRCTQP